ncbi:hypothetical protein V2J09_004715 [Rumex salicifolius]
MMKGNASACIINSNNTGRSKEEISHRQPNHNGDQNAAVKRHHGEHDHVPERGVDAEHDSGRRPPCAAAAGKLGGVSGEERGLDGGVSGDGIELEAEVLEVLVEDGEEETGEESERVIDP